MTNEDKARAKRLAIYIAGVPPELRWTPEFTRYVDEEADAISAALQGASSGEGVVQVQRDDAWKALRCIAEGNLGDMPWQAGYDVIRQVARGALPESMRPDLRELPTPAAATGGDVESALRQVIAEHGDGQPFADHFVSALANAARATLSPSDRDMRDGFDAADFGRKVRAKIDAGNLTFRTAAKRIGVSAATLNRVARGNDPDIHSYLKIAQWIAPAPPSQTGKEG